MNRNRFNHPKRNVIDRLDFVPEVQDELKEHPEAFVQYPSNLVIGVCRRCRRRGMLNKRYRRCTGYRAVPALNSSALRLEMRSDRCERSN